MTHPAAPKDVYWLLTDLCKKLGFSMAVRDQAHFERLVPQGADAFADAVLVAEGLDPKLEKHLQRQVRAFVAERFALWDSDCGA